ncbi:hypothetical protein BGP_0155 [Beggiatoa sp. PS]|nr:hypothetical protein BGP_0155 [Beggiatoa sp. PS]
MKDRLYGDNTMILQEEIIRELNLIPANKLAEIYDLIHYFRIGIKYKQAQQTDSKPLLMPRQPGILKGKLSDTFFEPLPEEELKAWET